MSNDKERIEEAAQVHANGLNPNDPDAMFDIGQMKRYAKKDFITGATYEHEYMDRQLREKDEKIKSLQWLLDTAYKLTMQE